MEPIVTTPSGVLRGVDRGAVNVFKGIPFATAARFERPEPVLSWSGTLDATSYGAQCPQNIGMVEQAMGTSSLPMHEDCLALNVFAPSHPAANDLPVLVWIHGGGFTSGSGAIPWYDGSNLVERGSVVVVTINYRLGAFGYTGTSNLGLRDQIVALQWVQRNIGAFGGNPADVTVFGESAGGAAIVSLLATPAAGGLFHRAFAMSPSITQLRSRERAEEAQAQFLAAAGARRLEDLMSAPAQRILSVQNELGLQGAASMTAFSPCVDDDLVPGDMLPAAAGNPVPLVIGTTRDEWHLFSAFDPAGASTEAEVEALFAKRFGEGAATALHAYRAARPEANPKQLMSALHTDEVFRVPSRKLAEARAARGHQSWMYWFTWATPAFGGLLGSCHALDIPFAFHNLGRRGVEQFTGNGAERAVVADAYSGALLSFASTGDPGWGRYETDGRLTRRFDVESPVVADPEPELRAVWARA